MTSSFYYPSNYKIEPRGAWSFLDHLEDDLKRVFIITGQKAMKNLGLIDHLKDQARDKGISIFIHSGIKTNPTNVDADEAARACKDFGADVIVGLGGGSSLDLAKITAMLTKNEGKSWDYISVTGKPALKIQIPALPIILIPTTSGTGSETTPFAVITHHDTNMKKGMGHPYLYPTKVIIDPWVLSKMSKKLTAISGLDAFGQALEGYTSGKSTLHSEHFGLNALEAIIPNLSLCFKEPENIEARTKMAWGASLAGLSIGLVDVNLAHAMSHPLSGHYDIQHGLAVALCTAPAISFNKNSLAEKYYNVAVLFGFNGQKEEAGDWLAQKYYSWVKQFGLDMALKNYGVNYDDLEMITTDAMEIGAIRTNIKPVSFEDCRHLFEQVWNGKL